MDSAFGDNDIDFDVVALKSGECKGVHRIYKHDTLEDVLCGRLDYSIMPGRLTLFSQRIAMELGVDPLGIMVMIIGVFAGLMGPNTSIYDSPEASMQGVRALDWCDLCQPRFLM